MFQALSELDRVDAAPVGELHDVLIPHQVVGVLGHRRERRIGRPGPAFGRREIARLQHAVHPELEEGPGLLDGPGQGRRVGPGQLARVAAAGQVRHHHVDLVLALPFVDPRGGALAGRVGVVGQHDALGEVPQQGEVLLGQRGATGGDGPGHAGLEGADDIGVALADDDLALRDDAHSWPS